MNHLLFAFFLIASLIFGSSNTVQARLNILTGGVIVGYDYDETSYDANDREDALTRQNSYLKQFSIGPIFILETSSSLDNLTISFNPSYTYDLEESSNDIDHNFSLSAYRDFTRRLRVDISERFIYTDDPELREAANTSDFNQGRRRYWNNYFNINSTYNYSTESSFGAGYSYQILRNDDTGMGGYEDYDRHIADLSLQHQFNSTWNIDLIASFTRGLFDPPDSEISEAIGNELETNSPGLTDSIDFNELSNDLTEYRTTATVNWILSPRKTIFTSYDFSASNYDAILRNDSIIHNLTIGGQYQYTRHLSFELGAGPSYEKTENFDANWDYNIHAGLNYDIAENSHIELNGKKGYEHDNFSTNNNQLGNNQGLTEFWEWDLNLSHELVKDLTTTLFASYRDERQESVLFGIVNNAASGGDLGTADREEFREESIFNRKIYLAGGSLSYTFMQWYTAAVRYTYRQQDSEQFNDSYDEHRLFLTFSVEKELFRW